MYQVCICRCCSSITVDTGRAVLSSKRCKGCVPFGQQASSSKSKGVWALGYEESLARLGFNCLREAAKDFQEVSSFQRWVDKALGIFNVWERSSCPSCVKHTQLTTNLILPLAWNISVNLKMSWYFYAFLYICTVKSLAYLYFVCIHICLYTYVCVRVYTLTQNPQLNQPVTWMALTQLLKRKLCKTTCSSTTYRASKKNPKQNTKIQPKNPLAQISCRRWKLKFRPLNTNIGRNPEPDPIFAVYTSYTFFHLRHARLTLASIASQTQAH